MLLWPDARSAPNLTHTRNRVRYSWQLADCLPRPLWRQSAQPALKSKLTAVYSAAMGVIAATQHVAVAGELSTARCYRCGAPGDLFTAITAREYSFSHLHNLAARCSRHSLPPTRPATPCQAALQRPQWGQHPAHCVAAAAARTTQVPLWRPGGGSGSGGAGRRRAAATPPTPRSRAHTARPNRWETLVPWPCVFMQLCRLTRCSC